MERARQNVMQKVIEDQKKGQNTAETQDKCKNKLEMQDQDKNKNAKCKTMGKHQNTIGNKCKRGTVK